MRKSAFPIAHFFIIAAAIFLVYSNTFEAPFIFDDQANITLNPYVKIDNLSWDSLKNVSTLSPNKRRWLSNVSFALNYYFTGLNVFGFHLVNIVIHLTTAFSFFLLTKFTLNLNVFDGFTKKTEVALVATLIWAVHPLQTNGVTYIVQRMTSMAALFYIWSLLCYALARISGSFVKRTILFASSIFAWVMALLSKENSGMLPFMIIGYEFFFLQKVNHEGRKKILMFSGFVFLVFAAISFLYLGSNPFAKILAGYNLREFNLYQRLLTETRIIFHYLSLLFLPLPSRLSITHNYPISTGFLAPPSTMVAFWGLLLLTFLSFYLFKRDRLISFAIFWFLGNLVIESSVIALDLVYEHRMYLPAMFLILAIVAKGYRLGSIRTSSVRLFFIIIIILLSFFTWQRNTTWKSDISIWTDEINKDPNSMLANLNLGAAYLRDRQFVEAEKYLLGAITLGNNDSRKDLNYVFKKNLANAHYNLGLVYSAKQDYPKALQETLLALEIDPLSPRPLVTLGKIYAKINQHELAYESYRKAADKGLATADLYIDWAISSFHIGRIDASISLLQSAINLAPNRPDAHYNLGVAYSKKGMHAKAQQEMIRAMKLRQKN